MMGSGEGSGEQLSTEMASPRAPSEGADDSSQYSSCGGESEFDRYSSANSVMGTPSIRSSFGTSHEFPESFKLDDDDNSINIKTFGTNKLLGFREPGFLDKRELGEGQLCMANKGDLYAVSGSSLADEVDFVGNIGMDEEWRGQGNVLEIAEPLCKHRREEQSVNAAGVERNRVNLGIDGGSSEIGTEPVEDGEFHGGVWHVDRNVEGLDLQEGEENDGEDVGRYSDEGEGSLRHEHSEGEDSMFGYGTDDEKIAPYYHRGPQGYREQHGENVNKLLMSSVVAFGSDDWDDFVLETGEDTFFPNGKDAFLDIKQHNMQNEVGCLNVDSAFTREGLVVELDEVRDIPMASLSEEHEEVKDIPMATNLVHKKCSSAKSADTSSLTMNGLLEFGAVEGKEVGRMIEANKDVISVNDTVNSLNTFTVSNMCEGGQLPLTKEVLLKDDFESLKIRDDELLNKDAYRNNDEFTGDLNNRDSENVGLKESNSLLDPLSDTVIEQHYLVKREGNQVRTNELPKSLDSKSSSLLADDTANMKVENSGITINQFDDHFALVKEKKFEVNEFVDEFVHEMEEILLDSGESPLSRFSRVHGLHQSLVPLPSRDGGSTASTSGKDDVHPSNQHSMRIDSIEVVGARQKEGDVSFSERLVGVKKYTVYKIRVWSGENYWDVERRYREFCTLYYQLKKQFADQGWILPSPWSFVERESRKIFANASPDVIAERSVLIQECLCSILQLKFSFTPFNALIRFLSPSNAIPSASESDAREPVSPSPAQSGNIQNLSTLGQTISLVVQVRPYRSMRQMLDTQHYTCAGCRKNFDDGKTRIREFVQTLGWGKPRLCEYTGQLFCSSCHSNDTSVLPAKVLHFWDFSQYPVSQLAKSYLDSIHDQPMLCVGAVNPFLFSKVPALQHVINIRKRIGAMLPYVRCPFRRSIYTGLGSRRYLLESNDFFALRDLIDLSKGIFAALPVMLETVSRKIVEHITEQCLICCDVGIPCNARKACDDPSSLIFPFQEDEIERCNTCQSVYHKRCFKRLASCHCKADVTLEEAMGRTVTLNSIGSNADSTSNLLGKRVDSSSGFLSGLFSKVRSYNSGDPIEQKPKGTDNIILMGSMPSTSL